MTLSPGYQTYAPIFKRMWRLALPIIVSNLLISLVNVIDVFMAGRLGAIEIAAVGMANSVRFLVIAATFAATAGAMTLAAQTYGNRNLDKLSFVARQALALTVLMALALSVVGWFVSAPALAFLNSGGDPAAVAMGTQYLQILFVGTVFLTISMVVSSLMQGAGDTVTPLYINAGTNVLNILFNYLFMFGPGPFPAYGVAGAAIGTVLARMIASGAGIYLLYSGRSVVRILPGNYKPHLQTFKDILSIGVPAGLQGLLHTTALVFVMRILTSTPAGTYGAAALSIGMQVESLSFMPGLAISVAATSMVGQALGAWQVQQARLRGNVAIVMGMIVMAFIAAPIIIFAPQIVRLFDPSAHPTVVAAGTSFMRISSLFHPILAVAMVSNGALQGSGDTRPGLLGTFLGRWLVGVPLAYLLALGLGLGPEGVWIALVIGTCVQATLLYLRWRSGAWNSVALHKSDVYRKHLRKLPEPAQHAYLSKVRAPLMALEGTTEQVTNEGVTYHTPQKVYRVSFSGESYELVQNNTTARENPLAS